MNYNSDTTGFICTTLHLQKVLQKSTKKCSRFFFTYVADDLPCKSKQNETLIVKANSLCDVNVFSFALICASTC